MENKKPKEEKDKMEEKKEKIVETKEDKKEEQTTENKTEKKEKSKETEKIKKTEAVVNAFGLPISTKYSMYICKFIKGKEIEKAISDLEMVLKQKKSVPMKSGIPHRKGKGNMSGRYPKKAAENFIKLLKSLLANSNANELENPVITEAVSNIGQRPFGRFGRTRKKRTHVRIIAKERKQGNKK